MTFRQAQGSDRTYRVANRLFATLFTAMGYRFDVRGTEHIPVSGGGVVAGNHIGFLDFTFIGYAARARGRRIRFMAKRTVFELPVIGWLMRSMGHIPVDRQAGWHAARIGLDRVASGELIGVFPEATISRSWLLKPFRRGAAGIALHHRVPLIPVVVWGGHRIYTVDGHWSLRRRVPITIVVGEPLVAGPDETVDELSGRLHESMAALLDEAVDTYPETPRNDADRWWLPHDRGGSAPDPATAAVLDREAVARIGDIFE